jgi:hypothetical protein
VSEDGEYTILKRKYIERGVRIAELEAKLPAVTLQACCDIQQDQIKALQAKLDAIKKLKRFDIDSDTGSREYISNGDFLDAWDVYIALQEQK